MKSASGSKLPPEITAEIEKLVEVKLEQKLNDIRNNSKWDQNSHFLTGSRLTSALPQVPLGRLLSIADVMQVTGRSRSTIRTWRKLGRLPVVGYLGRSPRFDPNVVQALITDEPDTAF